MREDKKNTFTFLIIFGILTVIAALSVLIYLVYSPRPQESTEETVLDLYREDFHAFMIKYKKIYGTNEEYERRYRNYKETLNEIEQLSNRWSEPVEYGISKFADMTQEEFEDKMLMHIPWGDKCVPLQLSCDNDGVENNYTTAQVGNAASKFSWRDKHYVGKVLDQELCNSCWAFSVVGVMESMLLISKQVNKYVQLSVQELTDCTIGAYQCGGGTPSVALKFMCYDTYNITREDEYPLTLVNQTCKRARKTGVTLSSFRVVCDMAAEDIVDIVYHHGPVVAVVSSFTWKNYIGGVIRYHCSDEWDRMNHVIQIVGYDKTDPVPHFIARNSWGRDFGDDGYVKIAMEGFICGIGRQISYLDVVKKGNF